MRPLILAGVVAALLASNAPVHAQETATPTTFIGPEPKLFWGGLVASGAPYLGGIMVAAESDRSADHPLYIPLVGPWLDLGQRSGCMGSTLGCKEPSFDMLLVADGLLQALGAASMITSFVLPNRYRPRAQPSTAALHFAPLLTRGVGGLGAFGTF